jgi:septal ring factor EnvC (AmiA/AmiB activator)
MGDTATLMNEGLYFEIRLGSKNLDPLEWLDTSQLALKQ